jgi:AP-4 complex subunit mu-1
VFFRKVRFWPGDPPPTFVSTNLGFKHFEQHVDGVNYFFAKKFGIYFVGTTKHNVSPSMVHEILYRMMKIFRDYCGIISEESIRRNFVMIYEIIDELIDYGHS